MNGTWIQTGGQDPTLKVDISSPQWWWEQRDRRSDQYILLMNPSWTILASLCYVVFVTLIGPWLMRDRKPFSLKRTMMAYNFLQVIISTYIVVEGWNAGWGRHYSWICQNVEAGTEPGSTAMRMVSISYVYLVNKYIELSDTLFFVLRKKNSQISLLHVYHHAIMPIYAWIQVRFLPGGHEIFVGLMNSFVHMVMYSYYLLSAFGPQMQPYLWWKRYLTQLQLIQFTVAIIRTLLVVTRMVDCGYPWLNCFGTLIFIETPFLYLFLDFYRKSYSNKKNLQNTSIKKDD